MRFHKLGPGAFSLASTLVFATAAQADLRIEFYEGAPKDGFKIENIGACSIVNSPIVIDLSRSQGGLIFDVTAIGPGVEVFHTLEFVQGASALASIPTVVDGQTEIELEIAQLAPSEAVEFTIDVDDTAGEREITVSQSEIFGTEVTLRTSITAFSAVSWSGPTVILPTPDC